LWQGVPVDSSHCRPVTVQVLDLLLGLRGRQRPSRQLPLRNPGLRSLNAGLCSLNLWLRSLDLGLWPLDLGLWPLNLGLWPLNLGLWPLDLGLWPLGLGLLLLGLSFLGLLRGHSLLLLFLLGGPNEHRDHQQKKCKPLP
jgi:hypothetical protein